MGTLYVDTGGATTNSGSTDQNAADLTGSAATAAASVVTLDGSPDLSGLVTSGATQSAIYLNQASNSNKKIFWITAFDNTLKTVTVDTAPTGITSSTWAIGGRQTVVDTALSVCRAGDTCIVNNSPASVAGTVATFRASGSTAAGAVRLIGKSGVRPVLTTTTTANCVVSGAFGYLWIENFEIQQQGATGAGIALNNSAADNCTIYNVRITDSGSGGAISVNDSVTGTVVQMCELVSAGPGYVSGDQFARLIFGCYIHDCTDGIRSRGDGFVVNCVIAGNSGRGFLKASATSSLAVVFIGCTIWKNLDGGIEDANNSGNQLLLVNSIVADNGTAAGEFNIEWINQSAQLATVGTGAGNCISQSGGSAGNVSNYTLHATDITTAPSMVDPDNGTAALRNFGLNSGSPCIANGEPSTYPGNTGTAPATNSGVVQTAVAAALIFSRQATLLRQ